MPTCHKVHPCSHIFLPSEGMSYSMKSPYKADPDLLRLGASIKVSPRRFRGYKLLCGSLLENEVPDNVQDIYRNPRVIGRLLAAVRNNWGRVVIIYITEYHSRYYSVSLGNLLFQSQVVGLNVFESNYYL